jgi:hypothetical protein
MILDGEKFHTQQCKIKNNKKMGLLVSATAEKKILIKGTEIELPSVYVRLEYGARANGTTLEIAATTYESKEAYSNGASALLTNVPMSNNTVELQEGEQQNLQSAELYSKASYEELGYTTEIL